jgi:predicted XRE-type DNA-binding protein
MKKTRQRISDEKVIPGSGNIFADLGLANPAEAIAKARLADVICRFLDEQGLNQKEAARRLGVDQPKISALRHGRLRGFSMERLIHFLNRLRHSVTIRIEPATKPAAEVGLYVAVA